MLFARTAGRDQGAVEHDRLLTQMREMREMKEKREKVRLVRQEEAFRGQVNVVTLGSDGGVVYYRGTELK